LAVTLAGLALLVDEAVNGEGTFANFPGFLLMVLFTALGALITVRQSGNRIGWLLLVIGFGLFLTGLLPHYVATEPESSSLLTVGVLVLDNWVGLSLIFYPLTLILFLFPDGSFFTRRQAWAGRLGWIMVPTSFLVALFVEEIGPPFQDPDEAWAITNEIGFLPTTALDAVLTVWGIGLVFIAAFGVWSLITRYRRSSHQVKAQIRWMMLAASILVVAFITIVAVDTDATLYGLFVGLAFAFIPVAITIAITRYRLFEIDRIISRTLSYTLVVGVLGLVYVFGALWLPTRLLGENESPIFVAGSTLAVAALFNPLRKRIQHGVDRRFNRSAYQAEVVSEGFAAKLRESLTTEELLEAWTQTVNESFQPELTGIWLNKNLTTTPKPDRHNRHYERLITST
jgi:hypothetical protein